jgi:hypothetical protein
MARQPRPTYLRHNRSTRTSLRSPAFCSAPAGPATTRCESIVQGRQCWLERRNEWTARLARPDTNGAAIISGAGCVRVELLVSLGRATELWVSQCWFNGVPTGGGMRCQRQVAMIQFSRKRTETRTVRKAKQNELKQSLKIQRGERVIVELGQE